MSADYGPSGAALGFPYTPPSGGGGGMTNPMTTAGDTIVGGVAGAPTRLGVGAEGTVQTVVGGVPAWAAPAAPGMSNPMTTLGDIIIGGALGAPARLGVGASGQVPTSNGTTIVWATPSSGVNTSLQAAPDTGWTAASGAGIGTAAIASGVATFTMTASQTSARLRRTVDVCSPHAPAVEFMARLTQTIADGVHEQGIGLTNAAYTRGVRIQIDIYNNATLYHNVSGSWVSGSFLGSVTGWGAGTLWLRLVATPGHVHFYWGSGAGPAPPAGWTRVASYNLCGASPDFTDALSRGLTDLVLFANRAGGTITNACTASNIQWRSLLGAPA